MSQRDGPRLLPELVAKATENGWCICDADWSAGEDCPGEGGELHQALGRIRQDRRLGHQ